MRITLKLTPRSLDNKIACIKALRMLIHNIGLREAKDLVEKAWFNSEQYLSAPIPPITVTATFDALTLMRMAFIPTQDDYSGYSHRDYILNQFNVEIVADNPPLHFIFS